jgi:microsomal dipeptidase-like Zn-dependent dipeptidase
VSAERGPWIDLHSHAGRCFLADLPAGHPMVSSLGTATVADAVRAAAAAGMTALMLADFGTEVIRLIEVAGAGHVAIGTDLDGNYRPVLTSYDQLANLAALLQDRGLPATHIQQVLGRNAADLLHRILQ